MAAEEHHHRTVVMPDPVVFVQATPRESHGHYYAYSADIERPSSPSSVALSPTILSKTTDCTLGEGQRPPREDAGWWSRMILVNPALCFMNALMAIIFVIPLALVTAFRTSDDLLRRPNVAAARAHLDRLDMPSSCDLRSTWVILYLHAAGVVHSIIVADWLLLLSIGALYDYILGEGRVSGAARSAGARQYWVDYVVRFTKKS